MNRLWWFAGAAAVALVAVPVAVSVPVQATARRVVAVARGETPPLDEATPPGLRPFRSVFFDAAKRYGLDINLLFAVSLQETRNSDPRAFRQEPVPAWITDSKVLNAARAAGWTNQQLSASYGLMQVLGATAWALAYRGKPTGLFEPRVCVELGARYLAGQVRAYKAKDNGVYLALCAYNGGGSVVRDILAGKSNARTAKATSYAAAVLRRLSAIKAKDYAAAIA
jgi:hypothetical protein